MISPTDLLTQFAVNIITTLFGVQDPSDENDDEIDDDFDEVFDNPDEHLHIRNGNNNVLEELTVDCLTYKNGDRYKMAQG